MESNSVAYGASLAGAGFDLIKFIKQPQTIIRVLSWVFSIVVFASITAEGYVNASTEVDVKCVFNGNDGVCRYGVGIGVIAFLACIGFLLADALLPSMSSAEERKYVVLADLGFSGAWTFLWFVCFCLTADQWTKTLDTSGIPTDGAHAVIAFSFFSLASWGALTYFALVRFRQGVGDVSRRYADPPTDVTSPYAPPTDITPPYAPPTYPSFQNTGPDVYQQPPFIPNPNPSDQNRYQPPVY
ncbi:synaptogyrin-2b [Pimephales promelas]|uniref:synaptogyrin-2b n=1 Tax=Pimephales promelas TaxID=90988 RepID=UPI0019554F84|nr:synaptogyrin-2b [Pimephales promelas]XP_039545949.1 synaptogyrin-2b [Pimephales promelas]XP_039545951.1 synaptogyrin-2b [Pimephales promelas]KAG1941730.1 synaptogyrin-1 isoform 1a [Pimephales promelas]